MKLTVMAKTLARAGAVLLIIGATVLLGMTVRSAFSPGPREATTDEALAAAANRASRSSGHAYAAIAVDGVDPAARAIDLSVTVDLRHAASRLVNDTGEPVPVEAVRGIVFRLTVSGDGVEPAVVDFVGPARLTDTVTRRLSVAARTHPQLFPEDTYDLAATVSLEALQSGADPGGRAIPVSLGVARGDRLVDWRIAAATELGRPQTDGAVPATLILGLTRPTHLTWFVYGVALAPLLLAFAAIFHRLRDRSSWLGMVELTAALLALLSVSEFAIPNDIQGITRLHHLLGWELGLITFVVAVATAIAYLRSSRPASRGAPPKPVQADLDPPEDTPAPDGRREPEPAQR